MPSYSWDDESGFHSFEYKDQDELIKKLELLGFEIIEAYGHLILPNFERCVRNEITHENVVFSQEEIDMMEQEDDFM